MSQHQQRDREKAQLLRRIQQQRLDLSAGKKNWLNTTARYDRGWQSLMQWRKYWIVGSSLVALYGVRHPSRMIRWGRRVVGLWGTFRLVRKTFDHRP
ncbi:YqjK-like family protein [Pectobacterium zantedeschiae]|uniref:Cell division protein FtsH n=1 Tax=Pectobacterium zantedeschiae TaxID=2034769 RepID=A0A9X8JND6_9GAMM|nr:YqjK-like family protein [Pectobacterium zantedeschiae]RYC37372.1 cell division protein FtsH [Pectobacterium zantedeschiae]RYC42620.1 cell division protein FtsH [Pectobacterium zantedeschiae]RYC45859.1 cell division protein FtsH [Pectobacterium zantedeschiae]RYC47086.1 cell division protein FtsH [Pectobacterium zantedeschiae]